MKKEMEIWLNPEEVQQLLEGGLYWKDIEEKISPENSDAIRRQIGKDELDIDEIIREASQKRTIEKISTIEDREEEIDEVRAILLGEERVTSNLLADNHTVPIVNRQINMEYIHEEIVKQSPIAATTDVSEKNVEYVQTNEQSSIRTDGESEVNFEERNSFLHLNDSLESATPGSPNSNILTAIHGISDDNFEEDEEVEMKKEASFGGLKLVILLVVVAALTFGFWYYFLTL